MKKWTVSIISLIVTGCTAETPLLVNVELCASNADFECVEDITEFGINEPELMITADMQNIVAGSLFTAQWRYLEEAEPYIIDTISYDLSDPNLKNVYSTFSIPDNGWPIGKYDIILQIDNVTVTTKSFIIR